jgi:hypothetical protein
MDKTKYYIYCLEFPDEYNEKTGNRDATLRYIGKTNNLKRRWREHRKGNSSATRQRDWDKCRFILEDIGNKDNIKELEQKWIDYYGGVSQLLNRNNARSL